MFRGWISEALMKGIYPSLEREPFMAGLSSKATLNKPKPPALLQVFICNLLHSPPSCVAAYLIIQLLIGYAATPTDLRVVYAG